MNKWYWAVPVALIVIASVAVALIGRKDVSPESVVCKTAMSEVISVSDTAALQHLDRSRTEFDALFASFAAGENLPAAPEGVLRVYAEADTLWCVLEDRPGAFAAIARGAGIPAAAEDLGGEGYNVARFRKELIGGWVYFAQYAKTITFESIYTDRLWDGLDAAQKARLTPNAIAEAAFIFTDASAAPSPAEYCQSAYAVCAKLACSDGSVMTVIFDPKTKIILGEAQ